MNTERIALYARVSSRQHTQERTIETQLAALRDSARTHQYAVDEEVMFVDDGVSRATLERPGLDALRDQALRGHLDRILILCPDRLARKHAHQWLVIEAFRRLGGDILCINRPLSKTPDDQ